MMITGGRPPGCRPKTTSAAARCGGRVRDVGGRGYPAVSACGETAACSTSISDSPRRFAS